MNPLHVPGQAVPSPEITLEFEEFFRAEYARLASALHILTGDREEAEDLAQEALSRGTSGGEGSV